MKKIKMAVRLFLVLLSAFTILLSVSCGEGDGPDDNGDDGEVYTVTFDTDGGGEIASQEVNDGSTVSKPKDPVKDGYSFEGWYRGNKEWNFKTNKVSSDIKLKAKYKLISYTVHYVDGENQEIMKSFTAEDLPFNISKEAIFNEAKDALSCGWYFDEDLTKPASRITETGNVVLYTKWSRGSEGLKYDTYSNGDVVVTDYTGSAEEIILPDCVTDINKNLFASNIKLTSINIPKSVKNIDAGAFAYCDSLESVKIDDLEAWLGILFADKYSNPLYYADKLLLNGKLVTSVEIPENISSVSAYAFAGYAALTEVKLHDGVTVIDDFAFEGCTSLFEITMSENVVYIGTNAFKNCYSLSSVEIPETLTSIQEGAFENCGSLSAVHIASADAWFKIDFKNKFSNPVYYAKSLYINGESIGEVTVPNGISKINPNAFRACDTIYEIVIPEGVDTISDFAFYDCVNLEKVTLPESLTSIGEFAFSYCEGLSEITLPKKLVTLGRSAFQGCTSLEAITIPKGITKIEKLSFAGCSSLEEMAIENGVCEIDEFAFGSCTALLKIALPDSLTKIGNLAFANCSSLKEVSLSRASSEIGRMAFAYFRSLEKIVLPKSVTKIDYCAFRECTSLKIYAEAASKPADWSSEWNSDGNNVTWKYKA